ncbi:biotin--[acetyl-CoA-carboxylase] ligase [Marinagarivorans algicola]|uniref:biotin--[acetyl-CoA-carboxylase] ligase n=1 Tax=Marinagarivorans algicola TaxID=1513270 RepID=UPI0037360F3F
MANNISWPLITCLADGEYHSGEYLGQQLGVGRAAIWKMVQQLQQAGLLIESVRGRGYRAAGGIDLLNAESINAQLSLAAKHCVSTLQVVRQIGSTNSTLATGEYGAGAVMLAEQQTAGRGRRGRSWVSPLASNIYLSVRWHFHQGIANLEGLSLAVGVALAEALGFHGVDDVQLKWPNDLWLKGKKLGGVLVEIGGDVNGDCYAVVGVGLNIAMPKAVAQDIDQPWIDLASVGVTDSRNAIAASLISHLVVLLSSYQVQGFARYKSAWLARNALQGQSVSVTGAAQLTGKVVGLSESGGLVLQTLSGEQVINGGEVSVRKMVQA